MAQDQSKFAPGAEPSGQIVITCSQCEKPVIATPRGYVLDSSSVEEGADSPYYRYTLLECDKSHPTLVVQVDTGESHTSFIWNDPRQVYPVQDRQLSILIPRQLRQIHEEARACFNTQAYTATAVMCGRMLEATCNLNNVTEKSLYQSLARMKTLGLIDGRLWEWADTLRTIRNAAAHYDGTTISKQDAADALAFNEALLDYLYVLSARFNELKARNSTPEPSRVVSRKAQPVTKSEPGGQEP